MKKTVLVALTTLTAAQQPLSAQQPQHNQALHVQAAPLDSTWLRSPELLSKLRAGGLVLACRHAITDRSFEDVRPIDFVDRAKQRNLDDRGRAQAAALKRGIETSGIPIGEVLTSPMYRARETAELVFGRFVMTPLLWEGNSDEGSFPSPFWNTVAQGSNRVLVSHQGVLMNIPGYRRGMLLEGDCVVLAPTVPQQRPILGVIRSADWATGGGR